MYYLKLILALAFSYQAIAMPNRNTYNPAQFGQSDYPTVGFMQAMRSKLLSQDQSRRFQLAAQHHALAAQYNAEEMEHNALAAQCHLKAMKHNRLSQKFLEELQYNTFTAYPENMLNGLIIENWKCIDVLLKIRDLLGGGWKEAPIWPEILPLLLAIGRTKGIIDVAKQNTYMTHVHSYQSDGSDKHKIREFLVPFIEKLSYSTIAKLSYHTEFMQECDILHQKLFSNQYTHQSVTNVRPNYLTLRERLLDLQGLARSLITNTPSLGACNESIKQDVRLDVPFRIQIFRDILQEQLKWCNAFGVKVGIRHMCVALCPNSGLPSPMPTNADVTLWFLHNMAIASPRNLQYFIANVPALILEGLLNAVSDYRSQVWFDPDLPIFITRDCVAAPLHG